MLTSTCASITQWQKVAICLMAFIGSPLPTCFADLLAGAQVVMK